VPQTVSPIHLPLRLTTMNQDCIPIFNKERARSNQVEARQLDFEPGLTLQELQES